MTARTYNKSSANLTPYPSFYRLMMAIVCLTFTLANSFNALANEPSQEAQTANLFPLVIATEKGPKRLMVELAVTPEQRRIGLMNRTTLPDNQGMLFVYPSSKSRSFWMKNTQIPLDIIFIDSTGRVINIEPGFPYSLEKRYSAAPAKYVLEVNLGLSRDLGIKQGSKINLDAMKNFLIFP